MDYFPRQNAKTISVFLIGLALVVMIGYVDYFTGEFSLDPFYLVVVFVVTWFAGAGCGMICVLEAVCAEAITDYYSVLGQAFTVSHVWNWVTDLLIFSAFCVLVGTIRHKVSGEA